MRYLSLRTSTTAQFGRMKSRLRYIATTILVLTGCLRSAAQFDGHWTNYMFNSGLYNPGSIGQDDYLNVHLDFREQWTGMVNSPSTMHLHVGAPLRTGNQLNGLGLLMINETIGLFRTQWFQAQYAYRKTLWQGELGIGLQGGILQQHFDASGIYVPTSDYHNTSDAAIPQGSLEGMLPDFSAGIWYRRGPWWTGLSCTHLLGGTLKLNEKESKSESDAASMKVSRTLYFSGGYNISFRNPLVVLQPSVLLRSDFIVLQTDVSALLLYDKHYWGGLNWRPGDSVGILAGIGFDFGLSVGYAFDIALQQTTGSHEVFVAYRKKLDTSKINRQQKSIRIL